MIEARPRRLVGENNGRRPKGGRMVAPMRKIVMRAPISNSSAGRETLLLLRFVLDAWYRQPSVKTVGKIQVVGPMVDVSFEPIIIWATTTLTG